MAPSSSPSMLVGLKTISTIYESVLPGKTIGVSYVVNFENGGHTVTQIAEPVLIYDSNGQEVSYWQTGTVFPGSPGTSTSAAISTSLSAPEMSSTAASSSGAIEITTSTESPHISSDQPATGNPQASGAASTATPSAAAQTASSSTSGLSRGGVGGIAVACIIVAALLGSLVTWAIMRRRTNHYRNLAGNQPGMVAGRADHESPPEKGMNSVAAPVNGNGADTGFLGGILPVTSDDKDVKQRMNGALEAASIHVDNFYENGQTVVPPEALAELANFDSPMMAASTKEMLASGILPKTIITRALTETLTSSIVPNADASMSLLPAEFGALPRSTETAGRNISNAENSPAYFWWRQLSVHLAPKTQENKDYLNTRSQNIAHMVSVFQTAFRPWRKAKYTEKQETDALKGIFTYAAEAGIWLFSQRSNFSFLWSRSVPPGEIEVRPALVKTADAKGHVLAKAREVIPRQLEKSGDGKF